MLRFTLQPLDEPEWMEKQVGTWDEVQNPIAVEGIIKIAKALATGTNRQALGHVRVYDAADICVLTATSENWKAGYQETLR